MLIQAVFSDSTAGWLQGLGEQNGSTAVPRARLGSVPHHIPGDHVRHRHNYPQTEVAVRTGANFICNIFYLISIMDIVLEIGPCFKVQNKFLHTYWMQWIVMQRIRWCDAIFFKMGVGRIPSYILKWSSWIVWEFSLKYFHFILNHSLKSQFITYYHRMGFLHIHILYI